MSALLTPVKRSRPESKINIVSPEPKRSLSEDEEVESPKKLTKRDHEESETSAPIEVSNEVKTVYKIIQKSTGATGGNGYNGAIYGELTAGSMQKVINFLVDSCELNSASRFIDVGAGLGKPNFHALQSPRVCLSIGVELEEIRWLLSIHNLKSYLSALTRDDEDLSLNHAINFIHADIDEAQSLDPFTHIYMYDLGFPPPLQQSIARKFNQSVHPRYLISYRPPRRVIHEYGYQVEHLHQMNTKMFGSGESHMAYFYRKKAAASRPPSLPKQKHITLSYRSADGEDEEVKCSCDALFVKAIEQSKSLEALKSFADEVVSDHLNSARTTRRGKK